MSKIKYFAGLIFVLGLLFVVSCTKDEASLVSNSNLLQGQTLVIEAVREDNDSIGTRTIRQDDGSVYWNPGDEISLFFMSGKDGGYKFTSQNEEVAKVTQFTGTISGITGGGEDIADDAYFWAIYPYSSDNVCESGSLVTTLPCAQQAIEGTFADDLFITVARSQNVKMAFKNVCGGVKFTVSQAGIKSVVFKGNNGEPLAGKSRIIFDDNNIPVVSEVIDGQTEILVTAPNGSTFEVGKYYYIVAFPNALEGGFSMKFNKTDGTSGTYTRTSKVTIKRSTFGSVKNLDNGITFVEDDTNISAGSNETGIYLGIIGFNDMLHPYPITHLNNESVKAYNSFIDGLTMKDNTLLYYAFDNSISKLQRATYPENLYNVSVVTFTDGYDMGSVDYDGVPYVSTVEYAAAIKNRMENETVAGHKITAYSLGIESDETSTSSSAFQTHLRNLATSEDNTFLVKNMNELNAKFMDIADSLSETKYVQEFTFSMSSPNPGTTIRFTFDNVSNPINSKLYIQGTFAREGDNKEIRKLKDITYKGLTSKSTSTEVIGVRNLTDTKYSYTFKDIQSLDGELIDTSYAVIWRNEGTGWASNINESSGVTGSDIEKVKRSAAIILNLDCSSSLKENFSELQKIAKSFIARLIENSIDPNEVSSISLNKSSISLLKGDSDKITATVLPATAYNKKIEWSSTNASVATVDADGVVTAVGPGNAKIIAKTVDGGYTATCRVCVEGNTPQVYDPIIVEVGPQTIEYSEINDEIKISLLWERIEVEVYEPLAYEAAYFWDIYNDYSIVASSGAILTFNEPMADGTPTSASMADLTFDSNKIQLGKDSAILTLHPVSSYLFQDVVIKFHYNIIRGDTGSGGTDDDADNPIYSTVPKDLTLAIWKDGQRYYLTKEQYDVANLSDAVIEGLTVVAGGESFVLSLNDVQTNDIYDVSTAQMLYKDIMPTEDQGRIISARYAEINNAISSFGGSRLEYTSPGSDRSGYYTLGTEENSDGNFTSCIFNYSNYNDYYGILTFVDYPYIRGVKSTDYNSAIYWTDPDDLKLSVIIDGNREFLDVEEYNKRKDVITKIEGVAVIAGGERFAIHLQDAQTSYLKDVYTAQMLYKDIMPTEDQGRIISAKYYDINSAISSFGGSRLKYTSPGSDRSGYYTLGTEENSDGNFTSCIINYSNYNDYYGILAFVDYPYIRGVTNLE